MAISSKTSNMLTDSGLSNANSAAAAAAQRAQELSDQLAARRAAQAQGAANAAASKANALAWLASKQQTDDTPTTGGNGGGGTKASTGTTTGGGNGGGGSTSISSGPSILDLLRQNYNNAIAGVNARYDAQDQQITNENEDALRQAYINYMMSRKNADNDMARQGYTGGLTESNRARMYNNYGNIRADLMKQRAQQLEEQRVKRNAELVQLLTNFNNQQARYLY